MLKIKKFFKLLKFEKSFLSINKILLSLDFTGLIY